MQFENKNLIIMGVSYFLVQLQFWFPIWIIFLLDRGITLQQIVIADIVYWFTIVILEFPMGIVGDRIGRKRTYFLGAIMGAIAYFLMIQINNFVTLLLSWLIWAVYISTMSGTDTAYIYELIVEAGKTHKTKYIMGYFSSIRSIALILSTLIAGFLYAINPNLPILLNLIGAVFAAFTILMITTIETKVKVVSKNQISTVLNLFRDNLKIRFLILFIGLLFTYTYAATLMFQPLLRSIDIPISQFGLIFATFPLFAVFGGLLSGHVADRLGDKIHLILMSIILVGFVVFIGILPSFYSILGIIGMYLCFALINPVLLEKLNFHIENQYRSSIISFANLIGSLGLIIARPSIAFLAEFSTIKSAYLYWGGFGAILLFFLLFFIPNKLVVDTNEN